MSTPEWIEKARKKSLPDEFIQRLDESETVTEEEKGKIVDALQVASDIPQPDPPPRPVETEDAPVIPDEEKPDTFLPVGLSLLSPNEKPVPGQHYVVWGSAHLDDIRERPVKKTCPFTEEEHVAREVHHTKVLLQHGLKNPKVWTDSKTGKPLMESEIGQPGAEVWDRVKRTEHYARWRYRGYVCGEVVSL